jgi:hypothetical protein
MALVPLLEQGVADALTGMAILTESPSIFE